MTFFQEIGYPVLELLLNYFIALFTLTGKSTSFRGIIRKWEYDQTCFLFQEMSNLPISSFPNTILNPVRTEGEEDQKTHIALSLDVPFLYIKHPVIFTGERHCFKCLIYINSFNPQDSSMIQVLLLPSFYRRGLERSSNWPTVICKASGRARIKTQAV